MGNVLICTDREVSFLHIRDKKIKHKLGCGIKILPKNSGFQKLKGQRLAERSSLTGKFKFTWLLNVNIWLTLNLSQAPLTRLESPD